MNAYSKRHPAVARSEDRARRAAFVRQIETAGDEALGATLERLEFLQRLSPFGQWQRRAIAAELESRP